MTDVSQLPIEDEAEAAEPQAADERRSRSDRRSGGDPGRRGRPAKQHSFLRATVRDVIAIALLVTAIVLTVSVVRPIYSAKGPVAQQILQGAVQPGVQTPPADTSIEARAIASPGFEADRKAFAADLVRTGRVPQDRADTIAFYAVREAYIRGIPPAVIFGVMLTENAVFVSNATSSVGAVGLMQVYPKIWLKELSNRFGKDLSTDSTNLKYGTFILSRYINPKGAPAAPGDVNKGLLRYNGCVRGTNTPNCKTYPNKVKNYVEKQAESLCGDKSFYDCIAKPFMVGLLGKNPAD
jgi:soluble lytic murein transglycosylase-like protein